MKRNHTLGLIIFLGIILSLIVVISRQSPSQVFEEKGAKENLYKNTEFGVEFTYPENYALEEKEVGDRQSRHYNITLIDKEELKSLLNTPARDGPPAITFNLYQNSIDKQPILSWVTGTNISNFKLSNGSYSSTTVGGREAIFYTWSGLYEAENYIFEHKEYIYSAAVTYIAPEDQILKDFKGILQTLRLQ